MLKRLLASVSVIAAVAVTGISAPATATSAPKVASAVAPRADGCTADSPSAKTLAAALITLDTIATQESPPDPTKVRQPAGDVIDMISAMQTAGCLPKFPATWADAKPTDCLQVAVYANANALILLGFAIKNVPSPSGIREAIGTMVRGIILFNTDKCLPFALPTHAPGGGVPTPPPGLPQPPTIPGT